MPYTRNRPGSATGAAQKVTTTTKTETTGPTRYPVAYGSAYAPTGRRHMWLVVVRCPFCRAGHAHRVRELAQARGARRPGCQSGAVYWVAVARTYRPRAVAS